MSQISAKQQNASIDPKESNSEQPMLSMQDTRNFVYNGDRSEFCHFKDGFGCFTDGKVAYHGQWSNGLPNGLGCLSTASYVYYGQINRGQIQGYGQMTCFEKIAKNTVEKAWVSVVGQFSNGSPDGPGVAIFSKDEGPSDSVTSEEHDCGLPRREGIFRGARMVQQALQPQSVARAVQCARRAHAIVAAGSGTGCGCEKERRVPEMEFVRMPPM